MTRTTTNPYRALHPLLKILVPIVGFLGGWLLVSLRPLVDVEFGVDLSRGDVFGGILEWSAYASPVYLPLIVLALWAASRASSRLSTHILVSSSLAFWPVAVFIAVTINGVTRNGESLRAAARIAHDGAPPVWGLLAGLASIAATEVFLLLQRGLRRTRHPA